MSRRIFICTDTDYPKLDAASNYVSNMAKALGMTGVDVYLISLDRKSVKDECENESLVWKKTELFSYISVPYFTNNRIEVLKSRNSCGKRMVSLLRNMDCSSNDAIITYLYKSKINKVIVTWANQNSIPIYATVVEWFEGKNKEQEKCFAQYGRCSGIIAISKNIEEYFRGLGLKTMILPPMVDMRQTSLKNVNSSDKVNFLYTGNFVGKDDMRVMLEALALLSDEIRSRIEFHVTRFDAESLKKVSGISEKVWNIVKDTVIAHGDVTVDELNKLLSIADYLPIARPQNRTTISNFPSKIPEAMSQGIVPIMTRVGDCPNDYLTDGVDSVLFDECTSMCCAQAFVRAVDMSESKDLIDMKNSACATAKKRFAIENYVDRLLLFVNES